MTVDFISSSAACEQNEEAAEYSTYFVLWPLVSVNAEINVFDVRHYSSLELLYCIYL